MYKILQDLIFNVAVNSYGHVEMVSSVEMAYSPSHSFCL